jgi:predicted metal-binding protein
MCPIVRKIVENVPDEVLKKDLERYRKMAMELGATDAKIITNDDIIIDDRTRMKCMYPKCPYYGSNINCPPYAPDVDYFRKVVKLYHYAIFITKEAPPEHYVGPNVLKDKTQVIYERKINEIVSKIEAAAFYDGYYYAIGFAGGPCKLQFCPDIACSALEGAGHACRAAIKAHSSLEGIGADAYRMATRVGWVIYPCGAQSEGVPCARGLGMILIY